MILGSFDAFFTSSGLPDAMTFLLRASPGFVLFPGYADPGLQTEFACLVVYEVYPGLLCLHNIGQHIDRLLHDHVCRYMSGQDLRKGIEYRQLFCPL